MTDSKKDATLATLAMAPSSTAPAVSTDSSTTKSSSSADNGRGGSTLAVALREVVEDLFSPSKLAVHPVLSGTLNTQGSVPLPVLAQLAEIQAAWSTAKKTSGGKKGEGGKEEGRELSAEGGQDVVRVLVEAVQMSRLVQLSDDGGGARPRVARSTIIARELPPDVTEPDVRALFQKWAEAVLEVRCEHGLWYIKLAGEDDAKAAFQALNGTPVEGQPLRLRIRPEVGQAVYGGFTPQSNTGAGAHMGGAPGGGGGGEGGAGRGRLGGAPSSPRAPGGMMMGPGRPLGPAGMLHVGTYPGGGGLLPPQQQHAHPPHPHHLSLPPPHNAYMMTGGGLGAPFIMDGHVLGPMPSGALVGGGGGGGGRGRGGGRGGGMFLGRNGPFNLPLQQGGGPMPLLQHQPGVGGAQSMPMRYHQQPPPPPGYSRPPRGAPHFPGSPHGPFPGGPMVMAGGGLLPAMGRGGKGGDRSGTGPLGGPGAPRATSQPTSPTGGGGGRGFEGGQLPSQSAPAQARRKQPQSQQPHFQHAQAPGGQQYQGGRMQQQQLPQLLSHQHQMHAQESMFGGGEMGPLPGTGLGKKKKGGGHQSHPQQGAQRGAGGTPGQPPHPAHGTADPAHLGGGRGGSMPAAPSSSTAAPLTGPEGKKSVVINGRRGAANGEGGGSGAGAGMGGNGTGPTGGEGSTAAPVSSKKGKNKKKGQQQQQQGAAPGVVTPAPVEISLTQDNFPPLSNLPAPGALGEAGGNEKARGEGLGKEDKLPHAAPRPVASHMPTVGGDRAVSHANPSTLPTRPSPMVEKNDGSAGLPRAKGGSDVAPMVPANVLESLQDKEGGLGKKAGESDTKPGDPACAAKDASLPPPTLTGSLVEKPPTSTSTSTTSSSSSSPTSSTATSTSTNTSTPALSTSSAPPSVPSSATTPTAPPPAPKGPWAAAVLRGAMHIDPSVPVRLPLRTAAPASPSAAASGGSASTAASSRASNNDSATGAGSNVSVGGEGGPPSSMSTAIGEENRSAASVGRKKMEGSGPERVSGGGEARVGRRGGRKRGWPNDVFVLICYSMPFPRRLVHLFVFVLSEASFCPLPSLPCSFLV